MGGIRKTITLGKMSKKSADLICNRVETVNSCNLAGLPYPPDVAQWLGTIGDNFHDNLHDNLSKAGLIEARAKTTLGGWCDRFLDRGKIKPSTKRTVQQTTDALTKYFGKDIDSKSISEEMAESFVESMRKRKLSPSTIDKRIKTARQIL